MTFDERERIEHAIEEIAGSAVRIEWPDWARESLRPCMASVKHRLGESVLLGGIDELAALERLLCWLLTDHAPAEVRERYGVRGAFDLIRRQDMWYAFPEVQSYMAARALGARE